MTVHILSLSGGGIRGIFQAVFLREISDQLGRPLRDHFDLIAGTSTGAIIALGIALNVDMQKMVSLFETKGKLIFPQATQRSAKKLTSYYFKGPLYSQEPLKSALLDVFRNGNTQFQLKDCTPPVVIASTNLDRYQIRSFTVLERCGALQSRDGELFAADVALASAGAPLYFAAHRPRGRMLNQQIRTEERTYIDGGIWANNPALHAAMTAMRSWGTQFADMRVISIGNGEVPAGSVGTDFNKLRRGMMIKPVLDMMFATQSELADSTLGTLLGDPDFSGNRMLRINAQLDQPIELDDVAQAISRLKPLAEQAARSTIGQFRGLMKPLAQ